MTQQTIGSALYQYTFVRRHCSSWGASCEPILSFKTLLEDADLNFYRTSRIVLLIPTKIHSLEISVFPQIQMFRLVRMNLDVHLTYRTAPARRDLKTSLISIRLPPPFTRVCLSALLRK